MEKKQLIGAHFHHPQAAPEAVCMPWISSNPDIPHYTYSGAYVKVKGIARGDATEFRWDFGDGTTSGAWETISDSYNLGKLHIYTGVLNRLFIATLYVKNASGDITQDTYPIKIFSELDLSQSANIRDRNNLDIRVNMSIDEGLWYLHRSMTRGTYLPDKPGYEQKYGNWDGGSLRDDLSATCAGVDAFKVHGSKVNGPYDDDPYVETVQRGFNYMLANTYSFDITTQASGDPDTNGNGKGLVTNINDNLNDGNQTYVGGVCMVTFASSGAPNNIAATGRDDIKDRKYADIVQDMIDFFAFGQDEGLARATDRGGWRYYANYSDADLSTTQWPLLGMMAAEENMGLTVPQFVREQAPNFINAMYHSASDINHGGYTYSASKNHFNVTKAALGMVSQYFLETPIDDPQNQASLGFIYRHCPLCQYM